LTAGSPALARPDAGRIGPSLRGERRRAIPRRLSDLFVLLELTQPALGGSLPIHNLADLVVLDHFVGEQLLGDLVQ
jgi:hypothetical protein